MSAPTRRPVTPTHTTSTPADSVEGPPEVLAHPIPPPPGQDAAAEDAIERKKRRLIAEEEADWRNTAHFVLRRDVPNIARELAERSLKQGTRVSGFDLYEGRRSQHQNACRCDESADAAAWVLDSALRAIAEKHYGGRRPPAVRDHWWHRGGDEVKRNRTIAAAMDEWESVCAETIERMVEAAIPGDVCHLRDRLGGQQRLDAKIRALSASAQPQREPSRDRDRGYEY